MHPQNFHTFNSPQQITSQDTTSSIDDEEDIDDYCVCSEDVVIF